MDHKIILIELHFKCYLKRTINLLNFKKINPFKTLDNHLKHHFKQNHQINPINHHFKHSKRLHNLNHKNHLKLFICVLIFSFLNLADAARVYKGKKHTTNSPIYFISAPFLPNRPINQFPPAPRSPYSSHSSNILPNVYNNLIASTTKSPINMVTRPVKLNSPLDQLNNLNSAVVNQTTNLQSNIASFLLKASANPNSFVNKLNNTNSPTDQVTRIKLKRKKLNRNSTLPNISQPIRTINVNFSLADLKNTFNNFKQIPPTNLNRNDAISNDKLMNRSDRPLDESPSKSTHTALPARLVNAIRPNTAAKQTPVSSFNVGDKSLNLLGEIILNR